jgi:hypothetical protein
MIYLAEDMRKRRKRLVGPVMELERRLPNSRLPFVAQRGKEVRELQLRQ